MNSYRDECHLTELQLGINSLIVWSVQCTQSQHGKFKQYFILHTHNHIWRRRRHLHHNRFWSAGGLSCRRLSNKGINKARTRCSLSKATGKGCTLKWAMPSAELCQWSHHMHHSNQIPYWYLLVQTSWPRIFRKNKDLKEITTEQPFLQLRVKKKQTTPSAGYTLFRNCNSVKFQKSFPDSESICLKSKFINTNWFTLTACPETPAITSYIS